MRDADLPPSAAGMNASPDPARRWKKAKSRSTRLDCVDKMPALRHKLPGQDFDVAKSEVLAWLIRQPTVANYLFDKAREHMVYDKETGTWRGHDCGC